MDRILPLKTPRPDAARFVDVLMGRVRGGRVPLVEYLVDEAVLRPVVEGVLGRTWAPDLGDRASLRAWLDNFIAFWHGLGYDCVRCERGLPFAEPKVTAGGPGHEGRARAWAEEHRGAIMSWRDFERYPWPRVEDFDFFPLEYVAGHLPDGMGLLSCHAGGLFEHLSWIMSFEGLCLALVEDRELVRAVAGRVGRLLVDFTRNLLGLEKIAAVFAGDDMGFRSSTLVSPADLRAFVLPWHKAIAALAHERGLPYFLHSCGNIEAIVPDLIDDVGIDGKHSFEDAIVPVEDFQARHGGRLAVLGGVDVNILAAGSPGDVRARTRRIIETCGGRGRFAVGSGNSIPDYVPVANYLAMVEEALRQGRP
jgi:uroporphyrinogen decarboxylase